MLRIQGCPESWWQRHLRDSQDAAPCGEPQCLSQRCLMQRDICFQN